MLEAASTQALFRGVALPPSPSLPRGDFVDRGTYADAGTYCHGGSGVATGVPSG